MSHDRETLTVDPQVTRFSHSTTRWVPSTVLVIVSVSIALSGFANDRHNRTTATNTIPRIDADLTMDGMLDEEVWASSWSIELGYEVSPGENIPAPVKTEVYIFHSRTHLCIGFRAHDPDPTAIRAHLSNRDNAWTDDWVAVVLDTFNDERRNYFLAVNPKGVQMDDIENWPGGQTDWDGIWFSAAQITEWGWSAEMKIPFSTLRFQRQNGPQQWRFDGVRSYPRNVSHRLGAFPRDRSNNCYLCQAVKIEGFEAVSPGRNLEIDPTLTGVRTDLREDLPDGPWQTAESEFELGLTARWGITPNLTLSGTFNPDFSQVEADARQLEVNQPFALFFPEKRPFFMEGADFFETPFDLVYTRMMRDPAWGLKLSGKDGPHTTGAYVVRDQVTNLIFPGSQSSDSTSLAMANTSTVLRYKYDIGNRYTLGGMVTDREGDDYFNRVAAVDGDFRFSATDRIIAQFMGSSTQYPQQVAEDFDQPIGTFDDTAIELLYSHDTRSLSWWAEYTDVGTDFRADLGFMPQVDFRHGEAGVGYTWNATDASWYSILDLKAKLAHTEDQRGGLLNDEAAVMFTAEGPLQSHAILRPSLHREGYNGEEFDFNRLFVHTCLKPNGHSHVWLNGTVGGKVDYVNTRDGDTVNLDGGLQYRFGKHLQFEGMYTHENMTVDEGWLYEANIGQVLLAWHFSSRTFVRAIVQHVSYDFNTDLYSDDRDSEYRELFGQFLFSYMINPRTVLFVGYTEESLGNQDYGLTGSSTSVFVKVGYAWVF